MDLLLLVVLVSIVTAQDTLYLDNVFQYGWSWSGQYNRGDSKAGTTFLGCPSEGGGDKTGRCVRLEGTIGGSSITKSFTGDFNAEEYHNTYITYDIGVSQVTNGEFCSIKYKYGSDSYTVAMLYYYAGVNGKAEGASASFSNATAADVTIQFDLNATSGSSYCYLHNFRFYGFKTPTNSPTHRPTKSPSISTLSPSNNPTSETSTPSLSPSTSPTTTSPSVSFGGNSNTDTQQSEQTSVVEKWWFWLLIAVVLIIVFSFLYVFCRKNKRSEITAVSQMSEMTSMSDINIGAHDPATGLPMKSIMYEQLVEFCDNNELNVAVCSADMDGMKYLNDTFGHQITDNIIKSIADIMNDASKQSKHVSVFRMNAGGDEFAMIVRCTTRESVILWADDLRKEIDQSTKASISIGVAMRKNNETKKQWFNRAEEALMEAKQGGKNKVVFTE